MQDWGFIASIEHFVSEIPNLAYTRPLGAAQRLSYDLHPMQERSPYGAGAREFGNSEQLTIPIIQAIQIISQLRGKNEHHSCNVALKSWPSARKFFASLRPNTGNGGKLSARQFIGRNCGSYGNSIANAQCRVAHSAGDLRRGGLYLLVLFPREREPGSGPQVIWHFHKCVTLPPEFGGGRVRRAAVHPARLRRYLYGLVYSFLFHGRKNKLIQPTLATFPQNIFHFFCKSACTDATGARTCK